ncbi:MAG: coenzyme F420-0:L-glutamate ligase [Pseudomonadota bacterium]
MQNLSLTALPDFPMVNPGDALDELIIQTLDKAEITLETNDVLVLAQKIVSKSENRYVDMADVTPSAEALELAEAVDKDPRQVQVVLSESKEVVRHAKGVLIVEHKLGFVSANAGIDQSNIDHTDGAETLLLLPTDPDGSASKLREQLNSHYNIDIGIVISDSWGRPWRVGTVGMAIGASGLSAVWDLRGRPDLFGRELEATDIGFGDEIAAAASLLMGQADEGCPVILLRGIKNRGEDVPVKAMLRDRTGDLFR